jgi:hypothetical protein
MAEVPSRFIRNTQDPFDLIRRHAFLGFDHHVHHRKPFMEGQVGVMEDRASGDREPIPAGVTIELTAGINSANAE